MRANYHEELNGLLDSLQHMAVLVEVAVREASSSLLEPDLARAEAVRSEVDESLRSRQEEATRLAEDTVNQARMEASALLEDARADAEVEKTTMMRQIKELERQRDSVAGYLEEMRGVLGNIMPQAPEFSDVISAALATGVPQAAGLSEVSSGSVSTDSAGSPEAPQSADSPASTSATEDDRSLQEDLLSMGGGRKRR